MTTVTVPSSPDATTPNATLGQVPARTKRRRTPLLVASLTVAAVLTTAGWRLLRSTLRS